MDLGLTGKRVLVTGGYRGTGAAIARNFAAEGAHVLVHGFETGDADAVVGEIGAAGGRASAAIGDLLSDEGANEIVRAVSAEGPVDVLINNYGIASGPRWAEAETGHWIDSYERNVLSGVRMARALVEPMKTKGWGRVVFVGTVGSLRPGRSTPHYYAAKTALGSVTVTLANELSGTGVTVNLVSPGVIRTAEVEAYFTEKAKRKGWGETWEQIEPHAVRSFMPNPCARFASVDEVAALVVFVASERASYVNAANLRVDGGAADTVS
jgi:3-oxoacyl-[acyl-carrier protein] reductase